MIILLGLDTDGQEMGNMWKLFDDSAIRVFVISIL